MRIAYLLSQYPAVSHTYLLREIRGLRRLGWDIETASILNCDRPADKLSPDEREEAARVFYVKSSGLATFLRAHVETIAKRPAGYVRGLIAALRTSKWNIRVALSHLFYLAEAVVVGCWMRRQGLTHVHTHFASTVTLFLGIVFPVTTSATIHGSGEFNDAIGFLLPEKTAAAKFIIAISSYGRSQLLRVSRPEYWDKVRIARLGVESHLYAPVSAPVVEMAPGEARPFSIIYVGRLDPPKAQSILLQACEKLLKRGRRISLQLVGDGPDAAHLRQMSQSLGIAEHVIFHGSVRHDKVLDLYRSADLFVLPSFNEGLPVVLMEAMALGLPCVATAITGIPELIRDGRDGLLVPPADLDGLVNAIELVMDDPELRLRLAASGRRRIVEHYEIENNITTLAGIMAHSLGE